MLYVGWIHRRTDRHTLKGSDKMNILTDISAENYIWVSIFAFFILCITLPTEFVMWCGVAVMMAILMYVPVVALIETFNHYYPSF